jgi:hypothetical protein
VLPLTGVTYVPDGAEPQRHRRLPRRPRPRRRPEQHRQALPASTRAPAAATEIAVSGGPLTNGDGLEQARGKLYVVRNVDNLVAEVELSRALDAAPRCCGR